MKIYIGTSGYAYKPWKGIFYPKDQPDNKMLSYYAGVFNSVEINNTFYAMPNKNTLGAWLKEVPAGFRFILKAPMEITHRKRLKECADAVKYFTETSETLGKNLAGYLYQLPPNYKKNIAVLEDFLNLLPPKLKISFEFRHESWFDEETYALLNKKKIALCTADTDELPADKITATTNYGYLRLRKTDYTKEELKSWYKKISEQDWKEVYIFLKHEEKAKGPKFATELKEIISAFGKK